jgi:hypothetical protein
MKTFAGGSTVVSGHYFNARTWEMVPIATDGGRLPGGSGDRYLRLSTPLVFLLTPILGLLFVVFMPLIGFVLIAHAGLRRASAAPELTPEIDPS